MTDLHKPLGQNQNPKKAGKTFPVIVGLIAIVLLGAAGYSVFKSAKTADPVVVSLNEVETKPAPEPENEPTSTEQSAQPVEPIQEAVVAQPKTTTEAPAFKPRKGESRKRPVGTPNVDLTEQSEFGLLPKIADSGLRPLDAYAVPTSTVGAVRIAIVMGGLGVSQTTTKRAIEALPSSVTLAYSPIGNSLQRWMQMARKEGHEIALQIPMEPLGYPAIDPGRSTLVSEADPGKNTANLRWSLGRMTNYPVVMNYLGANFTNNPVALRPILQELKSRGLGWLDDGSTLASKSLDIAEEIRLPHVSGNFVLDTKRESSKIASNLKVLEIYARKRGYAVATATIFPETVKQISDWIKDAEKRGIQIVPLSNLLRDYSR